MNRTFSTLFATLAQASSLHHDVNAFYDIPSISVREGILPKVLDSPEIEMPKWFRTGDDVTFDDESKVREWGGVAVDVMHVSRRHLSTMSKLMPDFGSRSSTRCELGHTIPIRADASNASLLAPIHMGSTFTSLPSCSSRSTFSHLDGKPRSTSPRPTSS
jgi:hypothetical protein